MSRTIIFVCNFILFFSFCASSQEITFGNYEIKIRYLKGDYKATKFSEEIVGTPFLDDEFRMGYLFFEGKDPVAVNMRYNIVDEGFEVRFEDDTLLVQGKIDIKLNEEMWKKLPYQAKEQNHLSPGYFKIVSKNYEEDDLILLEKPIKHLKEGQKPAAMKTMSPGKYLDRSYLYLKFPDAEAPVIVESRTKRFLTSFPAAHQDKLKAYIGKNKLKMKKLQDLERVISYYNGIE